MEGRPGTATIRQLWAEYRARDLPRVADDVAGALEVAFYTGASLALGRVNRGEMHCRVRLRAMDPLDEWGRMVCAASAEAQIVKGRGFAAMLEQLAGAGRQHLAGDVDSPVAQPRARSRVSTYRSAALKEWKHFAARAPSLTPPLLYNGRVDVVCQPGGRKLRRGEYRPGPSSESATICCLGCGRLLLIDLAVRSDGIVMYRVMCNRRFVRGGLWPGWLPQVGCEFNAFIRLAAWRAVRGLPVEGGDTLDRLPPVPPQGFRVFPRLI
jgi:hypothetical protein